MVLVSFLPSKFSFGGRRVQAVFLVGIVVVDGST